MQLGHIRLDPRPRQLNPQVMTEEVTKRGLKGALDGRLQDAVDLSGSKPRQC